MKRRLANGLMIPAWAMAGMLIWIGCQQKGDMSPTAPHSNVLKFIDTVIVNPQVVPVSGQAAVEVRIFNELNDVVADEDVRFTVSRGAICIAHSDTTVQTDSLGYAYATYTAPQDTGTVVLQVQLPSTWEVQTTLILATS